MASLTCPFPTNLNPLSSNGFKFSITKLPEVTFFCQSVSLPTVALGEAQQGNPFIDSLIPGEKLEFEPVTIEFIVDETMSNYKAIFDWINKLGFPESNDQFKQLLTEGDNFADPTANTLSDGSLIIYNSSNNPVATISFKDLFPVSLGSLRFSSTEPETQYLIGTATFRYTTFTI